MADPKTYTQEEYDAMIAERDALKANRDEILKEAKKAKDALKNYDGVDPAEFKALKDAAAEAERKKAASEGDFKALEKQLIDRHASELAVKDKRMGKLESALDRRLRQDELRKSLTGKVDPAMMELLVEHGSKFVQMRETDEDFEHYVTDGKGNQQFSDGQKTPMTVDLFVEQNLKAKFPGAFLGSGSSGGGATKSTAGGGGPKSIPAGDGAAFMANVGKVSSGEMTVQVAE